MSDKNIAKWIEEHRFVVVLIALLIIWGSFLVFLYFYAYEISTDPCSVCAKRMGDDISCIVGDIFGSIRVFYENGTVRTSYSTPSKPMVNVSTGMG